MIAKAMQKDPNHRNKQAPTFDLSSLSLYHIRVCVCVCKMMHGRVLFAMMILMNNKHFSFISSLFLSFLHVLFYFFKLFFHLFSLRSTTLFDVVHCDRLTTDVSCEEVGRDCQQETLKKCMCWCLPCSLLSPLLLG